MDIDQRLRQVEAVLDYRFKRTSLLSEALTAPGAENDQYDGNRRLSQLGLDVINLFLNLDGYTRKCERSKCDPCSDNTTAYPFFVKVKFLFANNNWAVSVTARLLGSA